MLVFHALFGNIAADTFEEHQPNGKILWHTRGTRETFLMAGLRSNKKKITKEWNQSKQNPW